MALSQLYWAKLSCVGLCVSAMGLGGLLAALAVRLLPWYFCEASKQVGRQPSLNNVLWVLLRVPLIITVTELALFRTRLFHGDQLDGKQW
eukprot:149773-Amphidinium_carterae.2